MGVFVAGNPRRYTLLYPATRDIPAGKAISKATPFRCDRPSPPWLEESVGEGGRIESRCVARRAVDDRAVREVYPRTGREAESSQVTSR